MNPQLKIHRHPGMWSVPQSVNSTNELNALTIQPDSVADCAENICNVLKQATQHYPDNKWITLIGTPPAHADVNPRQLQQWICESGLNPQRVRWVRTNNEQSRIWATEQALLLDNSALIIAWLGQCSSREQQRLLLATKRTTAKTLLYQQPVFSSPLH